LRKLTPVLAAKLAIDVIVGGLVCSPLAFLLRLDWTLGRFYHAAVVYTALSVAALLAVELIFRLPWRAWRTSGTNDLLHLFKALFFYGLLLGSIMFLMTPALIVPRSVPVIHGLIAFLALGGVRFASRLRSEKVSPARSRQVRPKKVLIVGAGEAGVMIAREMMRHPEAGLSPVGLLDDDPSKRRSVFLGLPVLGAIDDLPDVVPEKKVEEVLISIPSAEGALVRRIVALAIQADVPYRIVPGVYEVLSGAVSISHIREVDVADLLGREQVTLDTEAITRCLKEKRVLVTGAGGSIGSEIVRQVCGFAPSHVVLLGRGENSLFEAENSVMADFPGLPFDTVVADVRDRDKMRHVFERYRPQVIFHAAAHKHVPMMEKNPDQAVLNNIGGTRVMAELALEYGVERFVNISTDKAVNPTSVMGATKRIAEMVVRDAASRVKDGQSFVLVRFGNVLGSRGSVIPLFREQIRRGGPVTVTHPEMRRYFMTIPEAAQLVLQAAALDSSGTVYVLDMGKPIRISELAEDLIRLSGLEPYEDIEIVYTGVRPGEKLYEETLTPEEGTGATAHSKIFVARQNEIGEGFPTKVDWLLGAASRGSDEEILEAIREIVPMAPGDNSIPDGEGV
jgi:FlaA1/EpsC-like NDP-sugar epimerase